MPTTEEKKKFITDMYPLAHKATAELGLPETFFISQWAHETGYGTNTGSKNNNFAGINAYAGSPYGSNGQTFATKDDFLNSYINILKNNRYSGIYKANTTTEFAQALKAGGYATDVNYAYADTWTEVPKLAGSIDSTIKNPLSNWKSYDPTMGGSMIGGIGVENAMSNQELQENANIIESDKPSFWDNIFDPIKTGFAITIILILSLFLLYGAFYKDVKPVSSVGEGVANIATGGKLKLLKSLKG